VRCTTWNTAVAGFQIARQIRQARSPLIHFRVWNSQLALVSARAMSVEHVNDVAIATDEAEVDAHASTDAHAPVATGSYQDHVTLLTPRRKHFRRTEVCSRS